MSQDKVTIYDKVLEDIKQNKTKKEGGRATSIPPPFPRLAAKYPGWIKSTYTILTANSGIFKEVILALKIEYLYICNKI